MMMMPLSVLSLMDKRIDLSLLTAFYNEFSMPKMIDLDSKCIDKGHSMTSVFKITELGVTSINLSHLLGVTQPYKNY